MEYITTKGDSSKAQGVQERSSKVYKFTTDQVASKQQQNKLANAHTNKLVRPLMTCHLTIFLACFQSISVGFSKKKEEY